MVRAAAEFVARGGELDAAERKLLGNLGRSVCALWHRPDHGIWELRGPARHYTYSKAMCWVALDQLLRMHRQARLELDAGVVARERDRIRADIERRGFDQQVRSYVGCYGSQLADASLLLLARHGYVAADDPRMLDTCSYIEKQLGESGLLRRLRPVDGDFESQAYFAFCSFWLVDYLVRIGERPRAARLFEQLLELANDVGLYAENFAASDRSLCGNFPQAYTHVGLIMAAQALASGEQQPEPERHT